MTDEIQVSAPQTPGDESNGGGESSLRETIVDSKGTPTTFELEAPAEVQVVPEAPKRKAASRDRRS